MLQLKQKGEDLVVFIHAALSNDNVQRPVNLKERTVLITLHFCVRNVKNVKYFREEQTDIFIFSSCNAMVRLSKSCHFHHTFFFTPFLKVFNF